MIRQARTRVGIVGKIVMSIGSLVEVYPHSSAAVASEAIVPLIASAYASVAYVVEGRRALLVQRSYRSKEDVVRTSYVLMMTRTCCRARGHLGRLSRCWQASWRVVEKRSEETMQLQQDAICTRARSVGQDAGKGRVYCV